MDDLQILTVKETCSLLTCSVPTLYRWYNNGDLPFPKLKLGPNKVGFRKRDVEAYLNERANAEEEVA